MEKELKELNQPPNFGPLPTFNKLITGFFLPLQQTELHKTVTATRRPVSIIRNDIIVRFISKWRENVGSDIYPAFRLILPDHDRERQMYHLKENTLGKLLVKILNMSKDSPDAKSLLQWKKGPTTTAGNFSERCYDILAKRDTKPTYGDMTIGEVNDLLDRLSQGTKSQAEVMRTFITRMNAEELRWLIRIILRYSKIGVTEKTIFHIFHPDAVSLFNITSDLKRVCWQLSDPEYRLPNNENRVTLMSCFQPQLAAFTKHTYQKIVDVMPEDGFYMEEKMDGERIQLHFSRKVNKTTGSEVVQFQFFSRRAKDYTAMYGTSFDDLDGALTKHLRSVISPKVKSCIIDGEMVAWDPNEEMIVAFGSVKTAALNEQQNAGLSRPMYVAFDLIYLNGKNLVDAPLSARKEALNRIITPSRGVFVVLDYPLGKTPKDIEERFKKVIEEA